MNTPRPAVIISKDSAKKLVAKEKARWRQGETPDAPGWLARHPELKQFPSLIMDLAYEQYCLMEEGGDDICIAEYASQFPSYRSMVYDLLKEHRQCLEHPECFEVSLPEFQPGDRVDAFEIIELIGKGAFAHVYYAKQTHANNRPTVIKYSAQRSTEASRLAEYEHPHIVGVYHAWQLELGSAMAMPFMGTATLDRVIEALKDRAVPPQTGADLLDAIEACQELPSAKMHCGKSKLFSEDDPFDVAVAKVTRALASALDYLHKNNTFHADIKPANILLDRVGNPYLLDFNLALTMDVKVSGIRGTPIYLAPEYLRAIVDKSTTQITNDACSDLYGLGVCMWQLLTLDHPYFVLEFVTDSTKIADLVEMLPNVTPVASHDGCEDILTRVIALRREDRYGSAAELHTALTTLVAPTIPVPVIPEPVTPSQPQRNWVGRGVIAGMATLGVGLGITFWQQIESSARTESKPAETAESLFAQGIELLDEERFDAAFVLFESSYKKKKRGETAAYLAYVAAERNMHVFSVEYGRRAIEQGYASSAVYCNLSHAQFQNFNRDLALISAQRAVEMNENSIVAHYLIGQSAYSIAQKSTTPDLLYDITIQHCDIVCAKEPTKSMPYLYAALARLAKSSITDSQRERAIQMLSSAYTLGAPRTYLSQNLARKLTYDQIQKLNSIQPRSEPNLDSELKLLTRPILDIPVRP